jgi:hypothetical protein
MCQEPSESIKKKKKKDSTNNIKCCKRANEMRTRSSMMVTPHLFPRSQNGRI